MNRETTGVNARAMSSAHGNCILLTVTQSHRIGGISDIRTRYRLTPDEARRLRDELDGAAHEAAKRREEH